MKEAGWNSYEEEASINLIPTSISPAIDIVALNFAIIGSEHICLIFEYHQPNVVGLQLARIDNGNLALGGSTVGSNALDGLDKVFTLQNLAENDVSAIQPGSLHSGNEELRTVCVGSSICLQIFKVPIVQWQADVQMVIMKRSWSFIRESGFASKENRSWKTDPNASDDQKETAVSWDLF